MKPAAFYVLLVLVLLSLALNVVILVGLLAARQAVLDMLDVGLETVSGLEDETFETTVNIKQTIPIQAQVPFRRELDIPIALNVPISDAIEFDETLTVPIDTLVGQYNVRIPIRTTIPLDLDVPINTNIPFIISDTIPISTTVDIDLAVPFAIRVADTPLVDYLRSFRETLLAIRQQLSLAGK